MNQTQIALWLARFFMAALFGLAGLAAVTLTGGATSAEAGNCLTDTVVGLTLVGEAAGNSGAVTCDAATLEGNQSEANTRPATTKFTRDSGGQSQRFYRDGSPNQAETRYYANDNKTTGRESGNSRLSSSAAAQGAQVSDTSTAISGTPVSAQPQVSADTVAPSQRFYREGSPNQPSIAVRYYAGGNESTGSMAEGNLPVEVPAPAPLSSTDATSATGAPTVTSAAPVASAVSRGLPQPSVITAAPVVVSEGLPEAVSPAVDPASVEPVAPSGAEILSETSTPNAAADGSNSSVFDGTAWQWILAFATLALAVAISVIVLMPANGSAGVPSRTSSGPRSSPSPTRFPRREIWRLEFLAKPLLMGVVCLLALSLALLANWTTLMAGVAVGAILVIALMLLVPLNSAVTLSQIKARAPALPRSMRRQLPPKPAIHVTTLRQGISIRAAAIRAFLDPSRPDWLPRLMFAGAVLILALLAFTSGLVFLLLALTNPGSPRLPVSGVFTLFTIGLLLLALLRPPRQLRAARQLRLPGSEGSPPDELADDLIRGLAGSPQGVRRPRIKRFGPSGTEASDLSRYHGERR